MTEEYRRDLAAKAFLLRELRDAGRPTGAELLELLERGCHVARQRDPAFDFVFWTDGTYWDHLRLFAEWGLLVTSGENPPDDTYAWRATTLQITSSGLSFILEAEEAVGDIIKLFAPTRDSVTAA